VFSPGTKQNKSGSGSGKVALVYEERTREYNNKR